MELSKGQSAQMDEKPVVIVLSSIIGLLAAIASVTGLFSNGGRPSYAFSTLRGQTVQILGQGLYKYDTVFFGAGFKAQDAVVLFLGVPLLIISVVLYQRGSVSGHFLLTGVLGYFLYVYSSMALGAAYNRLFLLYIVIFSASLFALILVFSTVDLSWIASRIPVGLPRIGLAIFMFAAGLVTLVVWGAPLVAAMLIDVAPDKMDSYTTMVTYALDLAIITPATFLCALLTLRGNPLGYVIASPLLTLIILLAPQIILSTIFQKGAGVSFSKGEVIGPVAGFVILGMIATWLMAAILKAVARIP